MNKRINHNIVVVGHDQHNTLGVVRSLGIKGICPVVIVKGDVVDGYLELCKYVGTIKRLYSDNDILSELLTIGKSKDGKKKIIIACSDDIASLLDSQYEKLSIYYILPNAGGNNEVTHWMNKGNICEKARDMGIMVPPLVIIEKDSPLPENIQYPCITKAISSLDGGKSYTIVAQNREELEAFLSKDDINGKIIIEKYIVKDFEFQFFGLSLRNGKEVIIPGHSHIYRPGIQNEYYYKYLGNDNSFCDLLNKTRRLFAELGFEGLFSAEFIRGKDGKDYFLEINFRNDGNAICVTDAGYNLPYIWYLYGMGMDYQAELKKYRFKTVRFCPDVIYFTHMVSGELSFFEWLRTRIASNSFTTKYRGDNKPYHKNVKKLVGDIVKIIKTKIFNKLHL